MHPLQQRGKEGETMNKSTITTEKAFKELKRDFQQIELMQSTLLGAMKKIQAEIERVRNNIEVLDQVWIKENSLSINPN